jgi:tetratricopeptide (TPR) repeat protein
MFVRKALDNLDGMTERERYTTRGMLFRLTGDYKQCVEQHAELIKNYQADIIGRNQLAVCASNLRDIKRARDEMEAIVKLLPNRVLFRDNWSLYSSYISDFATGEEQALKVHEIAPTDAYGRVALGFAQMGQGKPDAAIETYRDLARVEKDKDGKDQFVYGAAGPTMSIAGLGSIALYQGRFAEAIRVLEQGAEADLAKFGARAAAKYAEVAYAQLSRGQKAAAVVAAGKALAAAENAPAVNKLRIRFLAARTFVEAGQPARAKPLAAALAAEVLPEPQAYAKIIEAQLAVAAKDPQAAIKLLTEANDLYPDVGTWIGHFELGRAFLAAEQFPQADAQFDKCLKRRGEANTLFLDEEPTFGYFPMVFYYQGRAREGMKLGGAESYRRYLEIREKAGEDPLIADIKKRIR